ncbi:hypothetical protein ACFQY0_15495 [Haloferula chungangensis]|uniref:Uncharacterized protein n=1 Tax=Haloferula chungangensis TaxID=1048331 RepID=A0ABW2LBA4_9BACT
MSSDDKMPPKRPARTGRGSVEVRVFGESSSDLRRGREEDEAALSEGGGNGPDDEDVVRLDQEAMPLANRRVEDEEPGTPDVLPRTGSKRWLNQRSLTIFMACMAVIVSVAVVLSAGALRKEEPGNRAYFETMEAIDELEPDPEKIANSDEILKEAVGLFSEYSTAKTLEEAIPLIRNGEHLRSRLTDQWEPMGRDENEALTVTGEMEQNDARTTVLLTGELRGKQFANLLIKEDGGFKVDWEASNGLGDVEFDQLKNIEVGDLVKMRLVLVRENFHPVDYPDDEFHCYSMWNLGGTEKIYGYAKIDSEPARALADSLNEQSVLLEKRSLAAVIVELKNEGRGEFGQFTITRVIGDGWIEP